MSIYQVRSGFCVHLWFSWHSCALHLACLFKAIFSLSACFSHHRGDGAASIRNNWWEAIAGVPLCRQAYISLAAEAVCQSPKSAVRLLWAHIALEASLKCKFSGLHYSSVFLPRVSLENFPFQQVKLQSHLGNINQGANKVLLVFLFLQNSVRYVPLW